MTIEMSYFLALIMCCFTSCLQSYLILISTHLKLCLAAETRNFKLVKITGKRRNL